MAAVLACGDGAVLTHRAAGALWRLVPFAKGSIDVTVPTRGGRAAAAGVTVHRARSVTADETTRHHGIPVTTPARTLLDLAVVLSRRRLERAVDEAERLRLCGASELANLLASRQGRTGAVALAAVLAEHQIGSTLTRSQLEEAFLSLCRDHDLPVPLVNEPVLDYVPDFLWPDARLIVEIDGRATHGTARAFQEDRARDARLTAAGYRPLRFTCRDVVKDRAVMANRVRTVLRLAGA